MALFNNEEKQWPYVPVDCIIKAPSYVETEGE